MTEEYIIAEGNRRGELIRRLIHFNFLKEGSLEDCFEPYCTDIKEIGRISKLLVTPTVWISVICLSKSNLKRRTEK